MYKAVLFDLDSTLVDSWPCWIEAYKAALETIGMEVTEQDILQNFHSGSRFVDYVANRGYDGNPYHVRTVRDAHYIQLLEERVEWMPGAQKLVALLSEQSIPMGIVTGSYRTYTDAIDRRLGISDYVEHIVTADDVEKIKPDPEGLELLLQKLAMEPQDCLYIGDQTSDMLASKALGISNCLVPINITNPTAHEHADKIVGSLEEIIDLILCK